MFRAILFTQWKWSRVGLAIATVTSFALPLLSVQAPNLPASLRIEAAWVLDAVEAWSRWYPALAAGLGLLLASSAWAADHRGKHVYALSLPIPRWQFALNRVAAGALLLLAPLVGFWLGAIIAAGTTELPAGLRSYPHALAIRFGLASLLSYAVFSAISAATARTAGYVLAAIGGVIWVQVMLGAAGSEINVLGEIFDRIAIWPGPLDVFTGRWTLIDV